jgi:branched-chain amino acid transport system ATP-binding protein
MLIVEQNANLALEIGDRGLVLESGNIVLQESAERLAKNDEIRRIYLGYE